MNSKMHSGNVTWLTLFLTSAFSLQLVYAQGTLRFDFSGLPPGEVLGEQFANSGIHFTSVGTADPPITTRVPEFLSPHGETVGTAVLFGVRFDQPITSLAFDIGQARQTFPMPSFPNYRAYAYDTAGNLVGVPTGGSFPAEEWHRANLSYLPEQRVSSLAIEGWVGAGENFRQQIFFDNVEVTFIPEPGALSLILFGGIVVLGIRKVRV